jgi:hypothetical protein
MTHYCIITVPFFFPFKNVAIKRFTLIWNTCYFVFQKRMVMSLLSRWYPHFEWFSFPCIVSLFFYFFFNWLNGEDIFLLKLNESHCIIEEDKLYIYQNVGIPLSILRIRRWPGVHMVFRLSFQNLWFSLHYTSPFCFFPIFDITSTYYTSPTKYQPRLNI